MLPMSVDFTLTEKLNTHYIYSILVKNMMRKMLSVMLIACLVYTVFLGASSRGEWGLYTTRVCGCVSNSDDGMAKIYDDGNWSCTNITTYYIVDGTYYIVDGTGETCEGFAIDSETTDHGMDYEDADFAFDPGWREEHDNCIAVGYAYAGERNYVFITNFTYDYIVPGIDGKPYYLGRCVPTKWEPLPTPIVYAKGLGWINITIPKFTAGVNANNTIGFAVYRNGLPIGDTTYSNNTHYFYNDTEISPTATYYYSVVVIAKGNYSTYGKSSDVKLQDGEPLQVMLNPPIGGEVWAGGSSHDISYTITGGSPPYNVVMSYSTNNGETYPNTINEIITHNEEGTYTYEWSVPKTNCSMMRVRVNVTDYALSADSKTSGTFTVDSKAPTIESTIPSSGGSVSISKHVTVVFSEKMNQTATQAAFEISPDPLDWSWKWNDVGDTMTGTHNDFVFGTTYTATITTAAKDLAGNYLDNAYPWNFTANMGVCINSPSYGDVWTGGVEHGINYTISGGVPDYEVKIYYSYNGGNWSFIAFDNRTEEGTYEYLWSPCPSIDSKTVNMKIIIVDGNGTESVDTSGNFEIDSTTPTIIAYSGNDTILPVTASITVWFNEEMNTVSVGIGAVQAGDAFGLFEEGNSTKVAGSITWNEDKDTMTFKPDANLTENIKYTAVINTNAKDKSYPGNSLTLNVSWNFTAVKGRGDFAVDFDYPLSPEKEETYSLTVTLYNTGEKSENVSGALTVKFYASRDGKTWISIDGEQPISNIEKNKTGFASVSYTFNDYGAYYFLIKITSDNPTDLFPNGENTYATSASVNIPSPSEEIGPGPYTLIALMVVIVVIVAAMILLSLKKKGELAVKEKTKEEKEEESEEEEGKGEE